ncbi:MAG TPA: hypothetical protein VHS80_16725 [Chthoniobacterales bacterium]|nr:hypothetical protein [Chthoniobacterales bacterium]
MRQLFIAISVLAVQAGAYATVDDAISRAIEAIGPYVKSGYAVRQDQWGGDLGVKQQQAITHTLFKGNDYWFVMGTDVDNARISIHVYDARGKLVETDAWQKGHFAAARVIAPVTGTYYIIAEVISSPVERTHWAMVYGYK